MGPTRSPTASAGTSGVGCAHDESLPSGIAETTAATKAAYSRHPLQNANIAAKSAKTLASAFRNNRAIATSAELSEATLPPSPDGSVHLALADAVASGIAETTAATIAADSRHPL